MRAPAAQPLRLLLRSRAERYVGRCVSQQWVDVAGETPSDLRAYEARSGTRSVSVCVGRKQRRSSRVTMPGRARVLIDEGRQGLRYRSGRPRREAQCAPVEQVVAAQTREGHKSLLRLS